MVEETPGAHQLIPLQSEIPQSFFPDPLILWAPRKVVGETVLRTTLDLALFWS